MNSTWDGSLLQVSVEEGEDRAKAEGIMFIETSAKGGYNIKVGGVIVGAGEGDVYFHPRFDTPFRSHSDAMLQVTDRKGISILVPHLKRLFDTMPMVSLVP